MFIKEVEMLQRKLFKMASLSPADDIISSLGYLAGPRGRTANTWLRRGRFSTASPATLSVKPQPRSASPPATSHRDNRLVPETRPVTPVELGESLMNNHSCRQLYTQQLPTLSTRRFILFDAICSCIDANVTNCYGQAKYSPNPGTIKPR